MATKIEEQESDHLHRKYTSERTNHYGYKTFSRTKEEFLTFYENELADQINEFEAEREKYWKVIKKRFFLVIIGLILLFIMFLFDQTDTLIKVVIYFNVFAFSLGFIAVWFTNWQKRVEDKVKISIVPKIVKFMNPNFTYDPNKHMPKTAFHEALIFKNKADGYTGDDLIKGFVYDEEEQAQTNVAFSEIAAINSHKVRTAKGKKRKKTGLQMIGLFFKVDFNKDFGRSVTIIKPRWLLKKRKYRRKLALYGNKTPLKEVHLENPAFKKQFIVHSNDQVNARVILQADTMQNLLDFVNYQSETLSGEPAKKRKRKHYIPYFTFRKNQIYLLLHTQRNHFNVYLFEKLTIETVYNYFKDINRVLRLIDDLNLNLDLYKK